MPVLPLPLAGKAVVLDEQGLDVLRQQLIILHAPVPQDAGGELVVGVAGPAQHHLHHLLTGPVQESTELPDLENPGLPILTSLSLFSLGQGIPGIILCRSYMRSEIAPLLCW